VRRRRADRLRRSASRKSTTRRDVARPQERSKKAASGHDLSLAAMQHRCDGQGRQFDTICSNITEQQSPPPFGGKIRRRPANTRYSWYEYIRGHPATIAARARLLVAPALGGIRPTRLLSRIALSDNGDWNLTQRRSAPPGHPESGQTCCGGPQFHGSAPR
jgi:hypothetical protein